MRAKGVPRAAVAAAVEEDGALRTNKERADETFVGSYKGHEGTFRMTENFHAKFDLDSFNEVFGFCKHPIVRGSGTKDFAGVRGRLDFRDDVDDPTNVSFPYKGHLRNLD